MIELHTRDFKRVREAEELNPAREAQRDLIFM